MADVKDVIYIDLLDNFKISRKMSYHRSHQKLTIGLFFQAWCTCQIRRPFSHFAVWSLLSVVKQVLARSSVVFLHAFVLGIFMCIHVYKSVFFWMALPSMPIERWQFMIGLWKGVGFQFKDIFPWCSMSPFCAGMSVKNPAVSMAQKMRAGCGFLFSGLWWPWKMVN